MFESINIHSSVAAYVQIENQVQFAVASGRLKSGDQLPSLMELAGKLGVNFNTIAKAYRDLEVMGIVHTRRGMGVFINKGVEGQCREACRKAIIARLHEVVTEARAAAMSAQDIKEVCSVSFASDSTPYGDTPDAVLALAKKQNVSKKK